MFQRRRPNRSVPRSLSLGLGGVMATMAVVAGGAVAAVSGPTDVTEADVRMVQNATTQEMEVGTPVDLDLEPVVAQAAGGTVPDGTTVQVTGLPDGLAQDGWIISGTPTRAGEYDVLITVSQSGQSKSERVAITVSDDGNSGTGTDESDEAESDQSTSEAESVPDAEEAGSAPDADGVDPTLSAVPGRGESVQDGDELGVGGPDAEEDGSPERCAIGAGDDVGTAALAAGLAPLLAGDGDGGDEVGEAAMVGTLLSAVAGVLPSLLGESGSATDAGSAGQLLCALTPGLFGEEEAEATAQAAVDETGTEVAVPDAGAVDAGLDDYAATMAGLSDLPAGVAGLFGANAGSLGG